MGSLQYAEVDGLHKVVAVCLALEVCMFLKNTAKKYSQLLAVLTVFQTNTERSTLQSCEIRCTIILTTFFTTNIVTNSSKVQIQRQIQIAAQIAA